MLVKKNVCYDKSHSFFMWRKKPMNFDGKKPKTKNQGTSQPEASQQFENGDMASEWEELVELDDVQLATVVGGATATVGGGATADGGGTLGAAAGVYADPATIENAVTVYNALVAVIRDVVIRIR